MLSRLFVALGVEKDWPQYTAAEVALHNSSNSLFIVRGEKVYDVTKLLEEHPGGSMALVRRGGGIKDCTRDYEFHSKKSRKEWALYQVGVLYPNGNPDLPKKPVHGQFQGQNAGKCCKTSVDEDGAVVLCPIHKQLSERGHFLHVTSSGNVGKQRDLLAPQESDVVFASCGSGYVMSPTASFTLTQDQTNAVVSTRDDSTA